MKDIAILWDLDGTLLDTLQDLADGVNHVLRGCGLPERSVEQVRRFVGNGARKLMEKALPGSPDDPPVEEALAAFQRFYSVNCRNKTKPYGGITDALEELTRQGYPMAIVSNKPDSAVKTLCMQYFPGLYAKGESEDCPRKPAPDMVFAAMQALKVRRCIYVGDSEVDVQTAKNAAVPCLSVLWGFRDRETLTQAGGQYFCEDPKQLPGILAAMEEEYGK